MPSAEDRKKIRASSSLSGNELRFMTEKVDGILYLCNPLANTGCCKTICFWNSWKVHDNDTCMCFKTCFKEYAARDAEGNPIVWPEGQETLRRLEEALEQENKRKNAKKTVRAEQRKEP